MAVNLLVWAFIFTGFNSLYPIQCSIYGLQKRYQPGYAKQMLHDKNQKAKIYDNVIEDSSDIGDNKHLWLSLIAQKETNAYRNIIDQQLNYEIFECQYHCLTVSNGFHNLLCQMLCSSPKFKTEKSEKKPIQAYDNQFRTSRNRRLKRIARSTDSESKEQTMIKSALITQSGTMMRSHQPTGKSQKQGKNYDNTFKPVFKPNWSAPRPITDDDTGEENEKDKSNTPIGDQLNANYNQASTLKPIYKPFWFKPKPYQA